MKRRIIISILLIFALLIYLNKFFSHKMKDILLPNAAHNNTIAQAPIFEAFDDQWFKPLHDSSTPSCDEIIFFTCNLKFDQTYAIAHRIATKEFFKSCLEAKEAHKVDTLGCEDLCEMD